MSRRVALLRGVNVGGNKPAPAAELRALGEGLGLADPQTVVNSGNLVFGSERTPEELETALADAVETRLGFRCEVFVRTSEAWRALIDGNPYSDAAERNGSQLMLTLLRRQPTEAELAALGAAAAPDERVEIRPGVIYADFPQGLGRSKLAERMSKLPGTGRNWNTVLKIAALLAA